MQKFKDFFYDDLSVTRGNYFLTLMAAFFITIILFIGIVVSEVHLLYSMLIVVSRFNSIEAIQNQFNLF